MASNNGGQNFEAAIMAQLNARFAPDKIKNALQTALDYGFSIMQDATPVRTGELKASEGISVGETEGEMHASVNYAGFVNGGTVNMAPNPFFDRGVAAAEQRLRENCAKL
jgi:hypothetical protein